jgi:phospholipid/cholesterol/gamma-HCH transport system permease protein
LIGMVGLVALARGIGGGLIGAAEGAGKNLVMMANALLWTRSAWTKRHEILSQCYAAGIESIGVVSIVGVFAGMILALSAGIELARFGQQDLVGALVSVSMAREMGPFMTGLILTANVGSSMAAELGTMKVSEEVEALEVMSIDVNRFLVMPRLVAMMIVTPLLTAVNDLLGNIGGAIVGYYQLGVTWQAYYLNAIEILDLKAVYTGLFKALVFGMVIATIGCGKGLRATGGAIGVGQATRTCVITCFLMIMMLGYFITAIFYGGSLSG